MLSTVMWQWQCIRDPRLPSLLYSQGTFLRHCLHTPIKKWKSGGFKETLRKKKRKKSRLDQRQSGLIDLSIFRLKGRGLCVWHGTYILVYNQVATPIARATPGRGCSSDNFASTAICILVPVFEYCIYSNPCVTPGVCTNWGKMVRLLFWIFSASLLPCVVNSFMVESRSFVKRATDAEICGAANYYICSDLTTCCPNGFVGAQLNIYLLPFGH
ncbi:hypothetical protein EV426DRAFT_182346 [Tirmania nivea]|nr:hypothetical protein EV426DRAFT_182346 [Tirmania nivea]